MKTLLRILNSTTIVDQFGFSQRGKVSVVMESTENFKTLL